MATAAKAPQTVTREDLERRFQALQDSLQGKIEERKQTLITVGASVGFVLLIIFFLLGRRSGRKKTTLVEIRRF
jgi:hypothetical protein